MLNPTGVEKQIESLKLPSSRGDDEMNSRVLINTKIVSSVILSAIAQSLLNNFVPKDWKVSKIIPLFKSLLNYLNIPFIPTSSGCWKNTL